MPDVQNYRIPQGNESGYIPVVTKSRAQRFEGYGDPGHDVSGSDYGSDTGTHDPTSEWRDPMDTATVTPEYTPEPPFVEPTPVVIVGDISEHARQTKQWRTWTVAITSDATGINKPILLVGKDPQRTALRIKSRTGNTKDVVIGSEQGVSITNGWALTGGTGYVEFTHQDAVWCVGTFIASDIGITVYVDVLVEYVVSL